MINILLASRDNRRFLDMITAFKAHDIPVDPVNSGSHALKKIENNTYHLFIVDESLPDMTGRVLIEKTVFLNPLLNCVAVSSLSHKEFHDVYEGMGVLMQFPMVPGTDDVKKLLTHLDKIYGLSKKTPRLKGAHPE